MVIFLKGLQAESGRYAPVVGNILLYSITAEAQEAIDLAGAQNSIPDIGAGYCQCTQRLGLGLAGVTSINKNQISHLDAYNQRMVWLLNDFC